MNSTQQYKVLRLQHLILSTFRFFWQDSKAYVMQTHPLLLKFHGKLFRQLPE